MSALGDLFKKLAVYSQKEQHQQVYEMSVEILGGSPDDARALKMCVVALINMDRYLRALRWLQGRELDDELRFCKLYAYYKLNMNRELLGELAAVCEPSRALQHLRAQALYRLGQYEASLALYRELAAIDGSDPEALDLMVNERAVLADGYQLGVFNHLNAHAPLVQLDPHAADSYDLVLNDAMIQSGLGHYTRALRLLDLAQHKCAAANAGPELAAELCPILLQRALILEKLGDRKKAVTILEQIQHVDHFSSLVLKNNLLSNTLGPAADDRLLLKELNYPNAIQANQPKFSFIQNTAFWLNYYKLAVKTGKAVKPKSNELIFQILESISKCGISFELDSEKTQAKKLLHHALKTKKLSDVLAAAQFCINVGNFDAAILVLNELQDDLKCTPGIASLLIKLYEQVHSAKGKLQVFHSVYAKFKDAHELTGSQYEFIKSICVEFMNVEYEKSVQLLQALQAHKPDELIDKILSNSDFNDDEINQQLLLSNFSRDELVDEALTSLNSKAGTATSYKIAKKHRSRHKSKRHLVKALDENAQLDAERWLPMKDRSYYKPKKSKKKAKDTQGGAADNTTELNMKSSVASTTGSSAAKSKKKKGRK